MRPVHIRPDLESLSAAVAEILAARIAAAAARQGRCSFVLSGGRTPRRLYELLRDRFADRIPWPQVDLFWSDERYVPYDDPQSNYRLAREALLDGIAIPVGNVHPIPTQYADPAEAAEAYEALIRSYFGTRPPRFDILLLGMAANGHVASLFPGHPALYERRRWIVAATVPAHPPRRVTMTFALLNKAAEVVFLVAGAAKADAVRRALAPGTTADEIPAVGVSPRSGAVTWWLDAEAAAKLGSEVPRADIP
ncbi:MAG: 6-phosphogluconolactonase [Armatimonadota bacterium]|nr:6-phosphogluconolactonase [Armatimonadota bacterium]MDR7468400.1 6-phosphogluconolactonase [Armatimonadota bacterium]MDR7494983.1 6-phosphogluconolactonase [Armatimonadota bacterium]MDR7559561.1 6-phosphogluconolactonase [Armatimonadota bacterium]MDR7574255.1 6-phosphogluconolactonase [Armatimonadota bacterium]